MLSAPDRAAVPVEDRHRRRSRRRSPLPGRRSSSRAPGCGRARARSASGSVIVLGGQRGERGRRGRAPARPRSGRRASPCRRRRSRAARASRSACRAACRSLPRTLSMQTPRAPLRALTFTVSPRRLRDPLGRRAAPGAGTAMRSSCRPVISQQPVGQVPVAVRRALDDVLVGEVEQQPVHRAERQARAAARRRARPAAPSGPGGRGLDIDAPDARHA